MDSSWEIIQKVRHISINFSPPFILLLNVSTSGVVPFLPGVVSYGEKADVSIPLGSITSRSDLSKILKIKMPVKGDNIKEALNKVSEKLFNPSSGARSDAAKSIYLFIDGRRASKLDISNELESLKRSGVKIVTVPYGGDYENPNDVRDVISPSDKWFFPENLNSLAVDDFIRPLAISALPGKQSYAVFTISSDGD